MTLQRKKLHQLFFPMFFETLFIMLAGMVDTLMLSSEGDQAGEHFTPLPENGWWPQLYLELSFLLFSPSADCFSEWACDYPHLYFVFLLLYQVKSAETRLAVAMDVSF